MSSCWIYEFGMVSKHSDRTEMRSLLVCSHEIRAVQRAVDTVRQLKQSDDLYLDDSDLAVSEQRAAIAKVEEFGYLLVYTFDGKGEPFKRVLLKMLFGDECVQCHIEMPAGAIDDLIWALEVLDYEQDKSLEALYRFAHRGWTGDGGDDE